MRSTTSLQLFFLLSPSTSSRKRVVVEPRAAVVREPSIRYVMGTYNGKDMKEERSRTTSTSSTWTI